jgi:hypothetical protein
LLAHSHRPEHGDTDGDFMITDYVVPDLTFVLNFIGTTSSPSLQWKP